MTCKIKNFITSYFGSGWLFFIPYLMLYLAFWISNSPVSILLKLFYILHALNAVGLGYFIYLKYRHINLRIYSFGRPSFLYFSMSEHIWNFHLIHGVTFLGYFNGSTLIKFMRLILITNFLTFLVLASWVSLTQ